jgi:hypothetical protein
LQRALLRDDERLVQGETTSPPFLEVVRGETVQAACALGWCGWHGEGLRTVAQVTGFFERICAEADQALGEPAASRSFLDWFDHTPRAEMRRELLQEVSRSLNDGADQAA